MTKQLESIIVHATIQGFIWWPQVLCEKTVKQVFYPRGKQRSSEWTGLRDALLTLSNDGDFQSTYLTQVVLVVTWRLDPSTIIQKTVDLQPTKETEDLWGEEVYIPGYDDEEEA